MVDIASVALILIAALLLFGPDKLPQYLREAGRYYAEFKKLQREFEVEANKDALVAQPVVRQPAAKVIEIARKMNIPVEGKTEEQLLGEIDAAVTKP